MKAPLGHSVHLNPVEDVLFVTAQLAAGIIPVDNASHDMRRPLARLDPSDARKMKRKFRKAWRAELKKQASSGTNHAKDVGLGAKQPTRYQKYARKLLVARAVWRDSVAPVLEKLSNHGT